MMLNALVVGINDYADGNQLSFCVNDANEVADLLEFNGDRDKTRNFSIMKLLDSEATKCNIMKALKKTFSDIADVGLFYFSGHGFDDEYDGKIVTYDYKTCDKGIPFKELLALINKSKCKNKVVVLDCCYAGKLGEDILIGDSTILPIGTTILTSCLNVETSRETQGHGVFTSLLLEGMKGGAADILGRITPASIYSFIDSSLGNFEQRPVFKSNVCSFVVLRNVASSFTPIEMRKLADYFPYQNYKYPLDSSYEPTNYPGSTEVAPKDLKEPYKIEEHTKIFSLFQRAVSKGLLKPSNEQHMYYAAMNSDTCELTEVGKHYWYMAKNKKI